MDKVYGIYEGVNLIPIKSTLILRVRNERITFISQLNKIGVIND